jgi:group I intron endonuclease
MVGIYKITSPNHQVYIGCTIDWDRRLKEYMNLRVKGSSKIYDSLIYHGFVNHTFEFIESCDVEQLYEKEIYWIKHFNSVEDGLNIRMGGRNGNLTQETKDKISQKLKGRKVTWTTGNNKGYKYTEEQKEKMRKPRKSGWEGKKLLPPNIVEEIRVKYATGNFTRSSLYREYGVSWGTIKNITDRINSYKD